MNRTALLFICGIAGQLWSPDLTALTAQELGPVATPREMLRIMRVDDSLLDQFVDDRPVDSSEQEALLRLLFRVPSFTQVDLNRWEKPLPKGILSHSISLQQLLAQHRFDVLAWKGNVKTIQRRQVIPELVERLGFDEFFEVTIQQSGLSAQVFVRDLPDAWKNVSAQQSIREFVRVQGLLLKKHNVADQEQLVLVAPKIQWYPQETSSRLGVGEDELLLSSMGVDIATLARVQQRSKMVGQDRESFYQILDAVHHAEITQFEKLGRRRFDIGRIIRKPQDVVSELYCIEGTARRAIRVEVDDQDIQSRFGIDHYFEIEVFTPLPQAVRFVDDRGQERVFRDYPFVFCVTELPDGFPLGDDIRMEVRAAGFFLKLWAYRTEFMAQVRTKDNRPADQLSPLLIGPTVVPKLPPPTDDSQLSLFIANLFVAGLAITWILLWRAGRHDRRRAKELFAKNLPRDQAFQHLQDHASQESPPAHES